LATWKASAHRIYDLLWNKYYVDEFYAATVVKPVREMSEFLWSFVDVKIVDGMVNGVAELSRFLGGTISFKMSGSVHRHAMVLVVGLVCLLSVLIFN